MMRIILVTDILSRGLVAEQTYLNGAYARRCAGRKRQIQQLLKSTMTWLRESVNIVPSVLPTPYIHGKKNALPISQIFDRGFHPCLAGVFRFFCALVRTSSAEPNRGRLVCLPRIIWISQLGNQLHWPEAQTRTCPRRSDSNVCIDNMASHQSE
jgi:hypothetical protein